MPNHTAINIEKAAKAAKICEIRGICVTTKLRRRTKPFRDFCAFSVTL